MADLVKTNLKTNGSAAAVPTQGAASQTIVVSKDTMCIRATNADAVKARVRVSAGTGIASALGDAYVDLEKDETVYIGPLESARFGTAGKITVLITGADDKAFGGTITNVALEVVQL